MQCCALVLATYRKQQTPQLWMEGTGEGCGFFCSQKSPYLSTMSQQFCRRLYIRDSSFKFKQPRARRFIFKRHVFHQFPNKNRKMAHRLWTHFLSLVSEQQTSLKYAYVFPVSKDRLLMDHSLSVDPLFSIITIFIFYFIFFLRNRRARKWKKQPHGDLFAARRKLASLARS